MHTLLRDLRFSLRQLRNAPVFAMTAILTLGLGIGAVTAVFTVAEAVLLRPLAFPEPEQLVSLREKIEPQPDELRVSAPDVLIFERESRALSGVAGYIGAEYELTGAGAPLHAQAERVTASLFDVLRVPPLLGRGFTQTEDENGAPVAVINYELWQERFQGSRDVIGKTVDLDRRPYAVIGVMPRWFQFPLEQGRLSHRDLWVPMSFSPVEKGSEGDNFDYGVVARLRPGVSMQQAQLDVDRVIAGIQAQYPPASGVRLSGALRPLKEEMVRNARPLLRLLLAAVALIWTIACVNLINLLLVRASGRGRELGMRAALGAGRRTIVRQLLTEGVLLSVLGGAAGIALSVVLVRTGVALLPDSLPRLGEVGVRWPVALLAFGLIGLTGTVCGLAPALAATKTDLMGALRDGGQGSGVRRAQHRVRGVLVVGEIAMTMLLLLSSGLLLRSFAKMLRTDSGFAPDHTLTASLALPLHDYPTQEKVDAFYARLQQRLEAMPGVRAVGFSSNIPVVGQKSGRLVSPEGYVRAKNEGWLIASNYLVEGNYFGALHIPLLKGRYFDASDDRADAPLTVVISQSFAERYFHGKDPIGMGIKVGPSYDTNMPSMRIVGVVGDIKQGALDQPVVMQMYEPLSRAADDLGPMRAMIGVSGSLNVVVRTSRDPAEMTQSLEAAVRQLDPLLPVSDIRTMNQVMEATESPRRFNTEVLTAFALTALSLSLLGIYGVLAYSVTERRREIAIRLALGATRKDVLGRTLRSALWLATAGVSIGLVASIGSLRLLNSMLYGVSGLDVPSITGAMGILFACSMMAAWLPARRAASVEPMEVLRAE